MVPQAPDACLPENTIEYELPLGLVGRLRGRPVTQRRLKRLFAYRHAVTRRAFDRPAASVPGTARACAP